MNTETERAVIVLRETDDVAVSTRDLAAGEVIDLSGRMVTVADDVPRGHKIALHPMPAGGQVHKYGQSIGVATIAIGAGRHVHTHNLGMDPAERPHEAAGRRAVLPPPPERRTFLGYRRAEGRAGTRNYVGILTSVNCAASTARMIAAHFTPEVLSRFESVDGVLPLTHGSGCGLVGQTEGTQILWRTLRGFARHPNFSALLVIGLGCEMMPVDVVLDGLDLPSDTHVEQLEIQECGGVRATVESGIGAIERMLPMAAARQREPVDAADLVLGLNCGGSDGYSGITANPALGHASDLLVAAGGTSVLAETPEVFGAEHLLTSRARDESVAAALLDRLEWWQHYISSAGGSLDNNPSPGNKAGGLTTILEKSLGAVAKAGGAELQAVYEYAEPITAHGLTFMDTPGYDPVSVTGLVAGGASVVCFTTGRGSAYGCRPTPSIKLATNDALWQRQRDDMDLNCGDIVDEGVSIEAKGEQIYEAILDVASGSRTRSELLPIGIEEFQPWHVGPVS